LFVCSRETVSFVCCNEERKKERKKKKKKKKNHQSRFSKEIRNTHKKKEGAGKSCPIADEV